MSALELAALRTSFWHARHHARSRPFRKRIAGAMHGAEFRCSRSLHDLAGVKSDVYRRRVAWGSVLTARSGRWRCWPIDEPAGPANVPRLDVGNAQLAVFDAPSRLVGIDAQTQNASPSSGRTPLSTPPVCQARRAIKTARSATGRSLNRLTQARHRCRDRHISFSSRPSWMAPQMCRPRTTTTTNTVETTTMMIAARLEAMSITEGSVLPAPHRRTSGARRPPGPPGGPRAGNRTWFAFQPGPIVSPCPASPNGVPSESRQIAQRSPGCTTSPPSSTTRSSAAEMSATRK